MAFRVAQAHRPLHTSIPDSDSIGNATKEDTIEDASPLEKGKGTSTIFAARGDIPVAVIRRQQSSLSCVYILLKQVQDRWWNHVL